MPRPRSEHQRAQEHPEDQDDEKYRKRDEEKYLGDPPEARRRAGEAEESRDKRNQKKDQRPFKHDVSPVYAGEAADVGRGPSAPRHVDQRRLSSAPARKPIAAAMPTICQGLSLT